MTYSELMDEEKGKRVEEHSVSGDDLLAKIKEIIREGNVRRIVVKDSSGKTLIEIPLSVGVVGLVLLPVWAAIGAIAALAADFKIVVERDETAPPPPPTS